MKKYLSLLLAILLVFSLVACGGDKDTKDDKDVTVSDNADDKNTGKDVYTLGDFVIAYKGAKIASDDDGYPSVIITVDFTNNSDSSASCGYYLYAKAEQGGEFMYPSTLSANEYYSKTAEPGETIDVTFGFVLNAVDYSGNRNYTDAITLSLENSTADATCSFTIDPTTLANADSSMSDTGAVDGDNTGNDGEIQGGAAWLDYWAGDWYGWWIMTDPTGEYEEFGEAVWDACATIEVYEDMTGYMSLWDEEGSADSLIAGILLGFANPDDTAYGVMSCEGGQFLSGMLESGDWIVDPDSLAYDNIFDFSGVYTDEYGTFSYRVVLRPWGTVWDDLGEEYYPAYYYDWYLPLVEANAAMPDTIG